MDLDRIRDSAKFWTAVLCAVLLFLLGFGAGWYAHAGHIAP